MFWLIILYLNLVMFMDIVYPHLYDITNKRSALNQNYFMRGLMAEYAMLIALTINTLLSYDEKYLVNFIMFLSLIILLSVRNYINFEQRWYKYRAVTESIKTTTWKFAMKVEPFNSTDESDDIKVYTSYLRDIVKDSKYAIETEALINIDGNSYSVCLKAIREMDFKQRRDLYTEQRIVEQREWYAKKAVHNRKKGRAWAAIILFLYILSLTMTGYLATDPSQASSLPIELVTTIVSSMIGWVQIKKYNELSASYTLTAHEIGLIKEQSAYVTSEKDFVDFVRDAETAFSREHTQWRARRIA